MKISYPQYLVKFLFPTCPLYLIILACLQRESFQAVYPESPLTLDVCYEWWFSIAQSPYPNLVLGYASPLVFAVFRIQPSFMLSSLFPYGNSSWIKSGFSSLYCYSFTAVWFWFYSTVNISGRPQIDRNLGLELLRMFAFSLS